MDFYRGMAKRRRMEGKRKARLVTKTQKAHAIDRLADILERDSWNHRFGLVQRLRAVPKKNGGDK